MNLIKQIICNIASGPINLCEPCQIERARKQVNLVVKPFFRHPWYS